jgi:hypothetical protein
LLAYNFPRNLAKAEEHEKPVLLVTIAVAVFLPLGAQAAENRFSQEASQPFG